jgi:hypothetical protein
MSIDTDIVRVTTDLAERTKIQAFRVGHYVLIVAHGTVPTPGYEVHIEPSPLKIYPQQYLLVRRERPGIWPDVVTDYRRSQVIVYTVDEDAVTIYHADGQDSVTIEAPGLDLDMFANSISRPGVTEPPTDEATGYSPSLSFDEAFADALENLNQIVPSYPDQLIHVEVTATGGLFGGFAGFHHLYVRVRRVRD